VGQLFKVNLSHKPTHMTLWRIEGKYSLKKIRKVLQLRIILPSVKCLDLKGTLDTTPDMSKQRFHSLTCMISDNDGTSTHGGVTTTSTPLCGFINPSTLDTKVCHHSFSIDEDGVNGIYEELFSGIVLTMRGSKGVKEALSNNTLEKIKMRRALCIRAQMEKLCMVAREDIYLEKVMHYSYHVLVQKFHGQYISKVSMEKNWLNRH
jgi:hypothetical protein